MIDSVTVGPYGTEFGMEYGVAYEVSKSGRVERILILPPESYVREIPPPPMRGRPIPLPVKPPVQKD